MNRSKLILVVLLSISPCSPAQIRHTSRSETDHVLLCARSILGKPVYGTVWGPWFDSSFLCPAGRQQLLDQLEERKIGVLENNSAVILMPTYMRPELGDPHYRIRWHKLNDIDVNVQDYDPAPQGSRPLSASEREEIAGTILRDALTPPLSTPLDANAGEDTANIELSLLLDVHHLSPKVESVVGILGELGHALGLDHMSEHDPNISPANCFNKTKIPNQPGYPDITFSDSDFSDDYALMWWLELYNGAQDHLGIQNWKELNIPTPTTNPPPCHQ